MGDEHCGHARLAGGMPYPLTGASQVASSPRPQKLRGGKFSPQTDSSRWQVLPADRFFEVAGSPLRQILRGGKFCPRWQDLAGGKFSPQTDSSRWRVLPADRFFEVASSPRRQILRGGEFSPQTDSSRWQDLAGGKILPVARSCQGYLYPFGDKRRHNGGSRRTARPTAERGLRNPASLWCAREKTCEEF